MRVRTSAQHRAWGFHEARAERWSWPDVLEACLSGFLLCAGPSPKPDYGNGLEASAALIRAARARAKKNCAERLANGVGAKVTITPIYYGELGPVRP